MEKTHDYLHHHLGCWRPGGIHRIEIFQARGRPPVIVCTESPEHVSRTGVMVECLAAAVVREHFPASFEEIGEPFVWIAHRPPAPDLGRPAAYQWVTFDSYAPRQVLHPGGTRHVALGRARWTPVYRAALEETLRRPYAEPSAAVACPAAVRIRRVFMWSTCGKTAAVLCGGAGAAGPDWGQDDIRRRDRQAQRTKGERR